jgi:hypothetical protein
VRYLFSLPNWLLDGFIKLVKMNDGRAQAILLYMLVIILRLRSERFWWIKKRTPPFPPPPFLFAKISGSLGE